MRTPCHPLRRGRSAAALSPLCDVPAGGMFPPRGPSAVPNRSAPIHPATSMRNPFARLLMTVALAALLPRGADAQDAGTTLRPGDTVRVQAPALHRGVIEGELMLYQTDSLGVREASTGTAYRFPLAAVERLEKNLGRDRRRSVRRWALAGLFVGAAAGLVSGPLIATEVDDGGIVGPTILSGLAGGVLGVGLGAAGGSVFAGDRWQRFRTPILSPDTPSARIGVTISVP